MRTPAVNYVIPIASDTLEDPLGTVATALPGIARRLRPERSSFQQRHELAPLILRNNYVVGSELPSGLVTTFTAKFNGNLLE